jgi:hypothetical protein
MVGAVLQPVGRVSRTTRKPNHTFQVRHRPWSIQPFLIAPVLAGETMKHMMIQSRAVSSPIKNALIGWHLEHFFFYVKLRDLDARDQLQTMLLDPDASIAGLTRGAADSATYTFAGAMDFVQMCLNKVTQEFFRDEGEPLSAGTIGGYSAMINNSNWLDSAVLDAEMETIPDPGIVVGGDDTIKMSEITQAMQLWEMQRAAGMTVKTFEDYLRSYGVSVPQEEELHRPELLRYLKTWSYPANTVNPVDGKPSSAMSWSIAEKSEKDRFFKEPGFIFGVTVARPKIYLSKQKGAAVGMLNSALSWLPAAVQSDVYSSMKRLAAGTGPLSDVTTPYWVDLKDLFVYGDQFVNFALTDTAAGLVAMPTVGLEKKYASSADADALFAGASPANVITQDGIVGLTVLGHAQDRTART